MKTITIHTTKHKEVVDITDMVSKELDGGTGICHLFTTHTTTALTTADLDPGTDLDILDAFEGMIPKRNYRHPHDPSHVGDHILSTLIGTSVSIPATTGKLTLGTWQRVVLLEFNGPRERTVILSIIPIAVDYKKI